MTLREIVNECLSALNRGSDSVIFSMPKIIKTFPRGELLCVCPDGLRTVRYDVMKVLDYLKKNRLIEVNQVGEKKLEVIVLDGAVKP